MKERYCDICRFKKSKLEMVANGMSATVDYCAVRPTRVDFPRADCLDFQPNFIKRIKNRREHFKKILGNDNG